MTSPAPLPSPGAGFAEPATAPRVLLVANDPARRVRLHDLLRRLSPACRIEAADDPIDALLAAARMRAELVLIDAVLTHGGAAALARHLARVTPAATAIVLDGLDASTPRRDRRSWILVERVCADWLQRRGGSARFARGQVDGVHA